MNQPSERAKKLIQPYLGAWIALMNAGIGPTEDTAIILRALASVALRSHRNEHIPKDELLQDAIQKEIDALESATVKQPTVHDTTTEPTTA